MPVRNRKFVLARRPQGMVSESDFQAKEEDLRDIKEGEILAKLAWLSFDPVQRSWLNEKVDYKPPIKLGDMVESLGVVQVVESKTSDFVKGDLLFGFLGWQEYWIFSAEEAKKMNKLSAAIPPNVFLNVCTGAGLAAYFGLLNIGSLKEGETVAVSGAAGATGNLAVQIAKLKGCKVIGIAGGPKKIKFLLEELKADHAIDYKSENVKQRLAELAPKGIDVYFDNVGGDILEAALENMANKGRILACGHISSYNGEKPKVPLSLDSVVSKRLKIEGFVSGDFFAEAPTAIGQLIGWYTEGKIKIIEDIQTGWQSIPKTFLRLFRGENVGKQLLKL